MQRERDLKKLKYHMLLIGILFYLTPNSERFNKIFIHF